MVDYYLSAAGDDSNSGSLYAPWKTITRLNAGFSSGEVGLRDRALLRRGDYFYGRLRPPTNLVSSSPGWLKIGAYGDGAPPIVAGYKLLNIASGWVEYDANTWMINFSSANHGVTYNGYDSAQGGGDVGVLVVDDVIRGMKMKTLQELVNQWDFYSTDTDLYVRSTANPTTLAGDIRCTVDGHGTFIKYATEVADLDITGHGGHGIRVSSGSDRNRVLRNKVHTIGGSTLDGFGDGTVRYGNGVEIVQNGNGNDFYGELNTVYDCYDCAWTIQVGVAGQAYSATNIMWRRNLTYRCAWAEEYFYLGNGDGFVNCVSEYNTNLFCGYGFGAETRPAAQHFLRSGLVTHDWGDNGALVADLKLHHNIFYDCRSSFSYHSSTPNGLISDNNVVWLRPATKMQYQKSQTVENSDLWVSDTGREAKSIIKILPSSSDVDITDSDVESAITELALRAPVGRVFGGDIVPIQAPWMSYVQ